MTYLGLVPKGFKIALANVASNLYFVAAIANTKPPMKSITVGSANAAIIALLESFSPTSPSIKESILLDVVSNISTITTTEVPQIGIGSRIHIIAAMTKIAIILCSTTVNPGTPKAVVGSSHTNNVTKIVAANPIIFLRSITI